ncbi:hypothetical protein CHS0354_022835 [Potamilus streckersoni]|uniref:Uncharacterized protein n=1 Tax=Potamilus streckersoni TaxID=2493646 RepID=A0AAE0S1R7_9BIVA|nr:hypothetical protein CHS0354_022835 [Potamilus streckersoni]
MKDSHFTFVSKKVYSAGITGKCHIDEPEQAVGMGIVGHRAQFPSGAKMRKIQLFFISEALEGGAKCVLSPALSKGGAKFMFCHRELSNLTMPLRGGQYCEGTRENLLIQQMDNPTDRQRGDMLNITNRIL